MTDVGLVREHNEDSVLAVEYMRESLVEPAQNYLYVVADGMGGAEAGEVASAIAVQTIRSYIEARLDTARGEIKDGAELLTAALEEANSQNYRIRGEPSGVARDGLDRRLRAGHADRRRGGVGRRQPRLPDRRRALRQVTKDHSSGAAAGRDWADHRRRSAYARAQERDHALARRASKRTGGRGGGRSQAETRGQAAAVQRRADGACR